MREIKFRAWDERNKIMIIAENLYNPNASFVALGFVHSTNLPQAPSEFHWMQYTGLKDKNGKEIYEGDILKDDRKHIGVVEWSGAGFTQKVNTRGGIQWWSLHNRYEFQEPTLYYHEVIGNIYETPELLEAK